MTLATGVGSMPGDDSQAYAEAVRLALGLLPDLAFVPELPGRGVTAGMIGRALAIVDGLGVDLQPAGWRLTDASGIDHRRARSLLAQDFDEIEEQAQGFTGAFKAQVAGPWTLAATVEKPRGDKVLSDHGARRELAEALAEGVRGHVADLRRRLPQVERLIVQVDEPMLPAVLGGGVPTASGFGRHRTVHPPEVSAALESVFGAIADSGAEPWLHSCAPGVLWGLVVGAGARGLSVDHDMLGPKDLDVLAQALDDGLVVALGVVPGTDPAAPQATSAIIERVRRWLDMLGHDPEELGDRLVLTPACGLAGASSPYARKAIETCREAAANLVG